jgi:hypothetical protein
MGLLKKMASIFGIVLIAVSIANVEFGALMSLDPPQKLILSRLADPGCNSDEIQKDLDSGEMNECATSPGVWDAPDLLLLLEGCVMFLTSFMRWPRKGRWAKRIRRTAIVSGFILCGLALADSFKVLPGVSSSNLAELLPFPAPSIAVQIGVFVVGIFLIRGPKYQVDYSSKGRTNEQKRERQIQDIDLAYKKGGHLGSLAKPSGSKGLSKYRTVGDLWGQQNLSQFEDEFEGGMRDDFGASVGRTCHLCTGEGCSGCGNTGMIS